MARFMVIEHSGLGSILCNDSVEVEGVDTPEEAAGVGTQCPTPMTAHLFGGAPNCWEVIDQVSTIGWPDGTQPTHQWIVTVVKLD